MFGFGGSNVEKDPKKALEQASNVLNKGMMGGLTKAFMGKDFVNTMNQNLNEANQYVSLMEGAQQVALNGADATAQVLSIQDTGKTVNMSPVVSVTLKIAPASGGVEFQTDAIVIPNRLAIPRAGDSIKIRYNPENPSQIAIL